MKIGIIGPEPVVKRCREIIREENKEVDIVECYYDDYKEAPGLTEQYQEQADGIMFVGKTPFRITEKQVACKVPWVFLGREINTLFRAMLETEVVQKKDLRRISFDTYEEDMILTAYEDIGIGEQELDIHIAEQRLTDENYHEYLKNFHCTNYKYHKASCCITGFTEISDALQEQGIPCVKTIAPRSVILAAYHQLEQKYMLKQKRDRQIVVMDVHINMPQSYVAVSGEEYIRVCNRNRLLENLYLFASRIEAAVIESASDEFLLFTTQNILHRETDDLHHLYLFELMKDMEIKDISIGIGYGDTVLDARNKAGAGKTEAEKAGSNMAFAVYGEGKIRGPIKLTKPVEGELKENDYMHQISKASGISLTVLWKIYQGVKYLGGRDITSKKLATVCEMSKRNMDRLIQKLEQAGACRVTEERMEGQTGRPSRIIRFKAF